MYSNVMENIDMYTPTYHNYLDNGLLFKIDETYKITIITADKNKIINLNKLIYGDKITYSSIKIHNKLLICYPELFTEYGLFENEIYDENEIAKTINDLSNLLTATNKVLLNKHTVELKTDNSNNYDFNKFNLVSVQDNFQKTNMDTSYAQNDKQNIIGFNFSTDYNMYKDISNYHDYYVLYNRYFLSTKFIKTDEINKIQLDKHFPELKILAIINVKNEMLDELKDQLYNITDEDFISSKLDSFINKKTVKPTFDMLKNIINKVFKRTSDINDRIQFNTIYTYVINELNKSICDEDKTIVTKLLPLVLKDIGLEKKRYSTGIFWYGLIYTKQENNNDINYKKLEMEESLNILEYLEKKRNKEIEDIYKLQKSN